jgi:hypothetical protein
MRTLPKRTLTLLAVAIVSAFFGGQAAAQSPITGDITFVGGVSLDTNTVNTATTVTAWHGLAAGDRPQVQSRDGTFATAGVNPGDGTLFHAPWTFNSGSISSFWSVDGFTFDLISSHIVQQGSGFLSVSGTGMVSATGFSTTPGTFNFTTQDSSANSQFSFSAATTAVPEGGTTALIAIGGIAIGLSKRLRRVVRV